MIAVFIPRTADGERMTGPASRGTPMARRVDSRTYRDPLATRNLSNCLPEPKRARKATTPESFAPKGWRLRTLTEYRAAMATNESASFYQPIRTDTPKENIDMPDTTSATYRLCTLGDGTCVRRDGHRGDCRQHLTKRQARLAAREAAKVATNG
jgi:hypothetical protein